jgi:hypothetical protein
MSCCLQLRKVGKIALADHICLYLFQKRISMIVQTKLNATFTINYIYQFVCELRKMEEPQYGSK